MRSPHYLAEILIAIAGVVMVGSLLYVCCMFLYLICLSCMNLI
jgi:hypothetical protein